jgi:rRNA biogenesis protein RRP5
VKSPRFAPQALEQNSELQIQTIISSPIASNMAPTKRKGDAAGVADAKSARKKARILADAQSKDPKSSRKATQPKPVGGKKHSPSGAHDSTAQTPKTSIFKDEEPSFPRGGGNLLTPIEKKQIQAKVNRDVLFEQQGLESHNPDDFGSDDNDDFDGGEAAKDGEVSIPVKKAKKTHKSGKKRSVPGREHGGVKVESLNFKVRSLADALYSHEAN